MPDHATPEPAEPATEPAHPKPAATARTVAAGVLFAALGAVIAATAVLVIPAFRLVGSGDARLDFGGPPAILLAVAFGAMNVAALLLLTRDWAPLRPVTAVLAFAVGMAWPLSGYPLPAAVLAIVAIGLALGRDRRVDGGRRITGLAPVGALAAAGLVLAISGSAIAESHRVKPPQPTKASEPASAADGVASTGVASGEATPGGPAVAAPSGDGSAGGAGHNGATGKAAPSGTADETAPNGTADEAAPNDAADEAADEAAPNDAADEATPNGAAGEATPNGAAGEAPNDAAPAEMAGEAPGGLAPTVAAEDAASGEVPAGKAPADAALPEADADSVGAEAPAGSLGDAASAATSFVRAYYRSLDEKRFGDAWDSLTPALRARFGGFAGWKAGYAKTLYSKPRGIAVTATGNGVAVKHLLVARDKNCAGERRFNVTWRLRRVSEQWRVTALTAAAAGANAAECR